MPGILGSRLIDADSGRSAWGRGLDVLWPRDHGYEMVLPIVPGYEQESRLVPDGIVDVVSLAFYRRPFYSVLVEHLTAKGYQLGNLDAPRPGDTLFLFDYDFRRNNWEAMTALRTALDHLRRSRGESEFEFDLLCQSNGAYLCRSLVRWGALADPDFGEGERSGPPRGLRPRRMVLAGTANAGGLRALRELRDGRRYVPSFHLGRHFKAETIFAIRSVFDDLPHASWREEGGVAQGGNGGTGQIPGGDSRHDLFIDEEGRPLDIDLYDAQTWRRLGWSVFSESAARRLERRAASELFGDERDRMIYLDQQLRDARWFQDLLARDPEPGVFLDLGLDLDLLLIQGREEPTIRRAVVTQRSDRWSTVFAGDPEAEELTESVRALLTEPGDGHATVASQNALSPLERSWLVGPPLYTSGTHFDLILNPEALERITDFLSSPTRTEVPNSASSSLSLSLPLSLKLSLSETERAAREDR